MRQPGYIRVIARQAQNATKIEWAHDSAWRFMPTQFMEDRGYCLHPIDLAINKVLALAGRDEAGDFLDVLHAHHQILGLPGLVWAACRKDPDFSPGSLLELLQRKGKYQPSDFTKAPMPLKAQRFGYRSSTLSFPNLARDKAAASSSSERGSALFSAKQDAVLTPI